MELEELKKRLTLLSEEKHKLVIEMSCAQFGYEHPWTRESLERIQKNNPTNFKRMMKYRDLKEKIATLQIEHVALTGREWRWQI